MRFWSSNLYYHLHIVFQNMLDETKMKIVMDIYYDFCKNNGFQPDILEISPDDFEELLRCMPADILFQGGCLYMGMEIRLNPDRTVPKCRSKANIVICER